jgi:hypothetical protein
VTWRSAGASQQLHLIEEERDQLKLRAYIVVAYLLGAGTENFPSSVLNASYLLRLRGRPTNFMVASVATSFALLGYQLAAVPELVSIWDCMMKLDIKRRETLAGGIVPTVSASIPSVTATATAAIATATTATTSARPSGAALDPHAEPHEDPPASLNSLWKLSPKKTVKASNVSEWRPGACLAWLECEANLAEYTQVFEMAGIDGACLLTLDEAQLERIGMQDPFDQEILLSRLQRLSYRSGNTSRRGSFTDAAVLCPPDD